MFEMIECRFCARELEKFLIKKFNYWTVYLHPNQCYLGRVYVILNRHGPEDTISLTEEEWQEFKIVLDKVVNVLKSLYNPDLFSYLALQNKDREHFHFHIIPRYKDKRTVHEQEFEDELWEKAPVPSPKKEFKEEILIKIKEDIKNML